MAGKPENTGKKTSIGGQALIEGVMMRGPKVTAMAVRHVSGEIVMEQWVTSGQSKPRVWKTPFLRGIYNMIDSMRFGYKCLMRSAELAGFEDEEPKKKVTAMDELSAGPGPDAEAVPPGPARTGLEPEEPVSDIGEESASPVPGPETTALPDPAVQPAAGETAKKEEEKPRGWFEKFGMTLLMTLSAVIGVALAVGLFYICRPSCTGGSPACSTALTAGTWQVIPFCAASARGAASDPVHRVSAPRDPDEGYAAGLHVPWRRT